MSTADLATACAKDFGHFTDCWTRNDFSDAKNSFWNLDDKCWDLAKRADFDGSSFDMGALDLCASRLNDLKNGTAHLDPTLP